MACASLMVPSLLHFIALARVFLQFLFSKMPHFLRCWHDAAFKISMNTLFVLHLMNFSVHITISLFQRIANRMEPPCHIPKSYPRKAWGLSNVPALQGLYYKKWDSHGDLQDKLYSVEACLRSREEWVPQNPAWSQRRCVMLCWGLQQNCNPSVWGRPIRVLSGRSLELLGNKDSLCEYCS